MLMLLAQTSTVPERSGEQRLLAHTFGPQKSAVTRPLVDACSSKRTCLLLRNWQKHMEKRKVMTAIAEPSLPPFHRTSVPSTSAASLSAREAHPLPLCAHAPRLASHERLTRLGRNPIAPRQAFGRQTPNSSAYQGKLACCSQNRKHTS
eukprot:932837-Amphidinium_carterae.1